MKLIVAVDRNWAIGKDGGLLVSIPEDMKFFRETTKGATVIMGRKTLESFPGGKPLKGRTNIVITSDTSYRAGEENEWPDRSLIIIHDIDELENVLTEPDEAFVIGGASIYRQLLDACDTAYITKINHEFDADVFFPNLDEDPEWEIASGGDRFIYHPADDPRATVSEDLEYSFYTYTRRK